MPFKRTATTAPANTYLVYCRVSTEAQERDGTSLDTQEAACRRHVAERGGVVVAAIRDAVSGATLDRPGLERARALLRARAAAVLLVYAVDRLTREQNRLGVLWDEAERHGYRLEAVTEQIEETPVGKMVAYLRTFVGELEREKIRERSIRGKRARIEAGRVHNYGAELYGYRRNKQAGTRSIYEPEAAVVRQIFAWCADGVSVRGIKRQLVLGKVPSPTDAKSGTTGTTSWSTAQVHRMLRNPAFRGEGLEWRWNGTRKGHNPVLRPEAEWVRLPEGTVPAIVTPEVWNRAQEALARKGGYAARNNTNPYLLRGIARCARCGRALYTETDNRNGRRYYRCSSRDTEQGRCGAGLCNADRLEAEVWSAVMVAIQDRDRWADEIARHLAQDSDVAEGNQESMRLRSELVRVERQIARTMASLGDLDTDLMGDAQRELNRLAARRRELNGVLADHDALRNRQRAALVSVAEVREYLDGLADDLAEMDFEGRRTVLEGLGITVVAAGRDWRAQGAVPFAAGVVSRMSLDAEQNTRKQPAALRFTLPAIEKGAWGRP